MLSREFKTPIRTHVVNSPLQWAAVLLVLIGLAGFSGCMTVASHSIPVRRLPPEWLANSQDGKVPLDFTQLGQAPPSWHRIEPRDVLGIYIQDVLGKADEPPSVVYQTRNDTVVSPAVGNPVTVAADGLIGLPLVPSIKVGGMTLPQAVEAIRKAYTVDQNILQPGRDNISVTLIKPRTARVVVIREDADTASPTLLRHDTTVLTKHGSAKTVELPAYENDVLHALAATGGLPGVDAYNEVWVLRKAAGAEGASSLVAQLEQGEDVSQLLPQLGEGSKIVRIPLRVDPHAPLPFGPEDIVLESGDVVYIESRQGEFFYTGGLLEGAQIPLPRDDDLDVIGALATANGSVGGPAGGIRAQAVNFRSGPGNIVPPSRVIVIRTLPDGGQIKIYVNLKRAYEDPNERLIIQPEDVVLLQYTPLELWTNVALNFINVGYAIPNK